MSDCCRRHSFDPSADVGLAHGNSGRMRREQRLVRELGGSMKSRQVGQKAHQRQHYRFIFGSRGSRNEPSTRLGVCSNQ